MALLKKWRGMFARAKKLLQVAVMVAYGRLGRKPQDGE